MWLVAWLGKVIATLIGGPGIVTLGDPGAPAAGPGSRLLAVIIVACAVIALAATSLIGQLP